MYRIFPGGKAAGAWRWSLTPFSAEVKIQIKSDKFIIVEMCTTLDGGGGFNPLQPTGHYMYHQFNIQQFYVLPTHCIYVFCVDLRTNSDYFPIQH